MNINNDMLCGPPYGAALKRYTTSVRPSVPPSRTSDFLEIKAVETSNLMETALDKSN